MAAGFGSLVDSIQTGDWLRTPRRLGTSLGILAGGAMAAHYGAHLEVTPLVKGLGLLSGIALGGAAGTATGATIGLARKLCGWGALTPK